MIIFSKTIFVSLFIGFLNIASLFAQNTEDTIVYVNLTSINPNADDSDLQQLDNYFENVKVIAMGESTHGTSEFTVMRHRMFKYLVENHKFNTFFLEADYANCLRTNAYIHGNEDDVKAVVSEINMWPWQTTEMVDLVNWMREYNLKNKTNQINFIGVDMQQYEETVKQMDNILHKNNMSTTDSIIYQKMLATNFFRVTEKKDLEVYKTVWKEKKGIDVSQLNKEGGRKYQILTRHLDQIMEDKYSEKSCRDKKMAANILFHINKDSTIKGMFFAHNGHIVNIVAKKNKKRQFAWAGGYLKLGLGNQYFSIGQDFDEGSFNAYYPDTNSTRMMEGKKYTLGKVIVGKSRNESIASTFRHLNTPIFIDYPTLNKFIKINDIGADYDPVRDGGSKSVARNQRYGKKGFDAFILIKKSTPTHLLKLRNIKTEK
jgi:erythromycin esterase